MCLRFIGVSQRCGMKIIVKGNIHRQSKFKIGPFRRKNWDVEPFTWSTEFSWHEDAPQDYHEIDSDLKVGIDTTNGVVLKALVKKVPTHLFQAEPGWSGSRTFRFESVSKIVVEGAVTVEGEADETPITVKAPQSHTKRLKREDVRTPVEPPKGEERPPLEEASSVTVSEGLLAQPPIENSTNRFPGLDNSRKQSLE